MEQKIFRKKSIDKINSPENLNDYIRVTNPGVWLILAAVIALLIGACVWGFFGHIDTTIDASAVFKNNEACCVVSEDNISSVKKGAVVYVGGKEGRVTEIGEYSEEKGGVCVYIEANVKDGGYTAKIVTESIKPASFIFN